uniref:Uncharacterized protein n=1 Tax=Setaria italica TaxID=4555 RepID=K3YXL8_SETIT
MNVITRTCKVCSISLMIFQPLLPGKIIASVQMLPREVMSFFFLPHKSNGTCHALNS